MKSKVLSPNSLPLVLWDPASLFLEFFFFLRQALIIRRVRIRVEHANGFVLIDVCTPNCHCYRVWRDVPVSAALSDLTKSTARNVHEGEEHNPEESKIRPRYLEELEHVQYSGCQWSYAYSPKSGAAHCNSLKEPNRNAGAPRDRLDGLNAEVEDQEAKPVNGALDM